MSRADTRAAQSRQAHTVLVRLLKTPKTRAGLVAAVTSRLISRRFVFGWLTEQIRTGMVVELKSGNSKTYQIKSVVIVEAPVLSVFPSWLDPRSVPAAEGRRRFVDGKFVADEVHTPPSQLKRRKK